jgi:hypothetical protein
MTIDFKLQSDDTKEISKALAKAHSEIENAAKDSVNPHFNSNFASLASIINATRETFAKNDLSIVQSTIPLGAELILVTTLTHSSGQWFRSYTPVLVARKDSQGMGSGLTYSRRYAQAAIANITQEDDDGNSASAPTPKNQPTAQKSQASASVNSLDPWDTRIPSHWRSPDAGKSLRELGTSGVSRLIGFLKNTKKNPSEEDRELLKKAELAVKTPQGKPSVIEPSHDFEVGEFDDQSFDLASGGNA